MSNRQTWIWPFSWYQRIKLLEAKNALLETQVAILRSELAKSQREFQAQAIAHSLAYNSWVSSMVSLTATTWSKK